jgi:hypothetical protein
MGIKKVMGCDRRRKKGLKKGQKKVVRFWRWDL